MFGFLGSSEELLYVLSDLLRLAYDVLRARHGGVFPALLSRLRRVGSWERAAVETLQSGSTSQLLAKCNLQVCKCANLQFSGQFSVTAPSVSRPYPVSSSSKWPGALS